MTLYEIKKTSFTYILYLLIYATYTVKSAHAVTSIKRSPFSYPVTEMFI